MMYLKKLAQILLIISLVAVSFATFNIAHGEPVFSLQNPQSPDVFLPIIFNPGPLPSVFGVETTYIDQTLLNKAGNIPTYWWRYNAFLWNQIEPQDVDPPQYNWGAVQENSLIAASQQGFSIVAVVKNTPLFAQAINDPANIPCSPIKSNQAGEFIEFIHELAVRYSAPPYNIRYWQLGNEPDVDVDLFSGANFNLRYTSPYGCWGDDADPYYGGEYYADFLKIFSDTIKAVNPSAQITNGGLLLDCHPVNDPSCLSGTFFEGMIKGLQDNNALSALDYVSFHAYARWYTNLRFDEEYKGFTSHGGVLLGKSYFLREVMTSYQLNPLKPLLVTEGGTMCARPDDAAPLPSGIKCSDPVPPPEFSDDQAEHLVWHYVRAIADGISGMTWYTLNYQAYRHVGLLNADSSNKPAYIAYQFLVSQLGDAQFVGPLNQYFPTLRAYEFSKNSQYIWVLWSPDQLDHSIFKPSGFQAAYDKLGSLINVPPGATTITINSPVYLILN
ncbi:MAG: hypothetical protein A2Z16_05020 [Chloroflexi bacterium RBG_16_54_18]|nr:MAG: hypothetical protein A2Z16_05020 [Chloroflexi bacterium RBG_16_54_18]